MKALVYDGHARLVSDYPLPVPQPGEARIRTVLAGICATDLEILGGYGDLKGVLGHEFTGVVDQAEDPELVGQRVVGEINIACGECRSCLRNMPSHCEQRAALGIRGYDGVIAEYCVLPTQNLHIVPAHVNSETAVFAEPLAAACQIVDQVHIRPSDQVIVLGDGKLGLLVAQVVALTGCDLLVVGRHADKLAILAERGIATFQGQPDSLGHTDIVIDCTGQPQGFETARQLVRPRGTLVLKSTYQGRVEMDLSSLVVDEVQIVGSRCGPFTPALRLMAQKLVDVASLVEAEYPLHQAHAALQHAGQRSSLKILIKMPEPDKR